MTTYGRILDNLIVVISMHLVLVWCVILSVNCGVLAEVEFYPDISPEDYMVEEIARFLRNQQERRPYPEQDTLAKQAFSFRFPEQTTGADESPFAVSPSDPRYYENAQPEPDAESEPERKRTSPSSEQPRWVASTSPTSYVEGYNPADVQDIGETLQRAAHVLPQRMAVEPAPDDNSDLYFIGIVAGCCAAAVVGIIAIGISWYKLQKNAKAAADVEYPAYGVTGPNKEVSPTGDRRLAQSAQMYHYQHQKQQIIAMESRIPAERNGSVSEAESEEENEEGDYTVYECPGLASTGEMEVKNPLFHDDPTPATPAPAPAGSDPAPQGKDSDTKKQP